LAEEQKRKKEEEDRARAQKALAEEQKRKKEEEDIKKDIVGDSAGAAASHAVRPAEKFKCCSIA
jgi:hypothetical protein